MSDVEPSNRGGRLAAVAGALGGVLALAGALASPLALPQVEPRFGDVPVVEVGAGVTRLVCPAAPQLTSAGGATEVDFDPDLGTGELLLPSTTTLVAVPPVDLPVKGGQVGQPPRDVPASARFSAEKTPFAASYPPLAGAGPSVVGLTRGHAEEGDLRGMVAGGCLTPSANSWLVGGTTDVGSSTQLVLSNVGESAARVRVNAWDGVGPVEGEIVELLDAGESRVVLTEMLQRTERLALHVAAEGGQVAAHLFTSSLEGIVPAGVSYVMPGAPPGTDTFVGPVHIEEFQDEEWTTDLRILNPGTDPADVDITLLGPDGEEPLGGAQGLVVEAGTVMELPITAPAPGEYTMHIVSSSPVAAGLRTSAMGEHIDGLGGRPTDVSWLASGRPTDHAMVVAGDGATIAVTNPAPDPVEITMDSLDEDGRVRQSDVLTLQARSSATVEPADGAAALRLSGAVVLASAQYKLDAQGPLIAAAPAAWMRLTGADVGVVARN